jgi:flagellar biosynthesis protein FlhF
VPLKTYRGASMGQLLAQAQAELGPEAVVLHVKGSAGGMELFAADPETADALQRMGGPADGRTGGRANRGKVATTGPTSTKESEDRRSPICLAFIGPTGAGKTTTVAKLAAHPRVFQGRKVGLLNLDTYRVGAIEQLGTYAALEGTPVASVYEPADLRAALKQLAGCDIILADCPGRGPRAERDHEAVRRILAELRPAEVHLVLPVGMQPQLLRRTVEHHRRLGATHLLASKVDEMPDDWILFDIAADLGLPMRWLSDGQRVPEDIRAATARLEATKAGRAGRRARLIEGVA